MVSALFLAGSYTLLRRRILTEAIVSGIALITHKAIWFFILLVILESLVVYRIHASSSAFLRLHC